MLRAFLTVCTVPQVPLVSSTDVHGGNWADRVAISPPYSYASSQSPAPSLDASPPMNVSEMQVRHWELTQIQNWRFVSVS